MKIEAKKRELMGKKSKLVRVESKLPAVVYGKGVDSMPLVVDEKQFGDVYVSAGGSTLVDLVIEDKPAVKVIIQEVQKDPVTDEYVHVSFFQIDLKKDVVATIPVVLKGGEKSPAVLEGGIIFQPTDEIEIRCKPLDLPPEIVIDVSKIKIGDNVSVGDIELPKGVELLREEEKERTLVSAGMPKEEEEEPEEVVDEEAAEGEESEGAEGEEGDAKKPDTASKDSEGDHSADKQQSKE